MDKLKSIKDNITLHINEGNFKDIKERNEIKVWLEGWIYGVTDIELHPEVSNSRDKAMSYMIEKYQSKVRKTKIGVHIR